MCLQTDKIRQEMFKEIVKANSKNQGDYAFQAWILSAMKPYGW
jgi:hypothetical protein